MMMILIPTLNHLSYSIASHLSVISNQLVYKSPFFPFIHPFRLIFSIIHSRSPFDKIFPVNMAPSVAILNIVSSCLIIAVSTLSPRQKVAFSCAGQKLTDSKNFPNPEDVCSNQFYSCPDGAAHAIPRNCPKGLVFDNRSG